MNNFEKACLLSNEQWVSSLPEEIADYTYSSRHNRRINKLFSRMRDNKYHRLTKGAARALVIAAIILSLSITAFAVPVSREFIIEKLSKYSLYKADDGYSEKRNKNLVCNYVPEGFSLYQEHRDENGFINAIEYKSDNGEWYMVEVTDLNSTVSFDTEYYESEEIEFNGVKYILFKSDKKNNGAIWNFGGYIYKISGSITYEKVFEVAKNTK